MPDRIDQLVERATPQQLRHLVSLLEHPTIETRDPEAIAASIGPTEANDLLVRLRSPEACIEALIPALSDGREAAVELVSAVLSPSTPLPRLKHAFEQARSLSQASNPYTRAAAELIYHAAAAMALTSYGTVLQRRAAAERGALYARLARQFAGGPFGSLFETSSVCTLASNPGKRPPET